MSGALLTGVAVVTGAASGIGAACCRELAARGARIAMLDRDERVYEVSREINGFAWIVDVADEHALKKCADSIEQKLGPAESLVNSAGVILRFFILDESHQSLLRFRVGFNVPLGGLDRFVTR